MIKTTIILCFLYYLITLIPAHKISEDPTEYYQDLLHEFLESSSQWQQPTDSRRFFNLIDEQEDASKSY